MTTDQPGPFLDNLFQADDELDSVKILAKLLEQTDLEMKTEIKNPLALTRLYLIGQYLDGMGFERTASSIKVFIDQYLLYMVSKDGNRAKQIVEALSNIKANDRMISEKLMGPPR